MSAHRVLLLQLFGVATVVALTLGLDAQRAQACGGFFCSATQPVNQAAERIIFASNLDNTVTAVVQIQYSGPSEDFAWVLPVPGIPDVAVSSDLAFQRLQQASNPQYILTTEIEGTCRSDQFSDANAGPTSFEGGGGTGGADGAGGVNVLAEGNVGPYDYVVIQPEASYENVGDVAVDWLVDEGYDVVPPGGDPASIAELLGSYLRDQMNLLAFRLTKGNDAGTIRPIWITYASERPMIPIRPTAVAANDDMGVMVWVLGEHRAVPINYLGLELNEALIDWNTGGSNYNQVVIAAANEAGGQGFVTERAGSNADYDNVVFSEGDESVWENLQRSASTEDSVDLLIESAYAYGVWDGYEDVVADFLPGEIPADEFVGCPECRRSELLPISPSVLLTALEDDVVEPMRATQELLASRPYVTRLYTTMSAPEMDMDPVFDFNPDLSPASNLHNAVRVIECDPTVFLSEAPSRIELEDGRVVRIAAGSPWPFTAGSDDAPPANAVVLELSTSGPGTVVEDNGDAIDAVLDAHNATVPGRFQLSGGGGCSISRDGSAPAGGLLFVVVIGLALGRRRRLG